MYHNKAVTRKTQNVRASTRLAFLFATIARMDDTAFCSIRRARWTSALREACAWCLPPDMPANQTVFLWMTAIFVACLIIANLIGSLLFRVATPWGPTALLSAGIIPFPVTFLLTDLLNEFFGRQAARLVTIIGFAVSVLVYGCLTLARALPVDPRSPLSGAEFTHFSGLYTSMIVASLAAYLVGQLLDIQIFHVFRAWTRHRFLWLRAQGSTVISQLFDSLIVTAVAFWGQLSIEAMGQLALSNYVWKFALVALITPFLYLGHAWLKRLIGWQEVLLARREPGYGDPHE